MKPSKLEISAKLDALRGQLTSAGCTVDEQKLNDFPMWLVGHGDVVATLFPRLSGPMKVSAFGVRWQTTADRLVADLKAGVFRRPANVPSEVCGLCGTPVIRVTADDRIDQKPWLVSVELDGRQHRCPEHAKIEREVEAELKAEEAARGRRTRRTARAATSV